MPRRIISMSNSYKTDCPNCGGNNLYVTPSNGVSYCFNCSHYSRNSNSPIKPIKRYKSIPDIRAYYDEITKYYHSCLSVEHRQWLYGRGISDYSINKLRIGFCPNDVHLTYKNTIAKISGLVMPDGMPAMGGRIIFPFFAEGLVTDVWGRAIDKDNPIRYRGPAFPAYSRGADYTYCHDSAYKNPEYVVRTEGIIKTVIANQYGIHCVGYPGTTAYRSGTPPMIGQKQIICFDSQVAHRRELLRAIKTEAARYKNAYIAALPLRGSSKTDIDSYILKYGIDDFRRIIDSALPFEQWQQLAA